MGKGIMHIALFLRRYYHCCELEEMMIRRVMIHCLACFCRAGREHMP